MTDRPGFRNGYYPPPSRGGVESSRWGPEVAEGVAAGEAWYERERWGVVGWMKEEISLAVASDAPSAVVELHVVEAAQQDAAVDVGLALISVPVVDVVGFAVRRRPIATGPAAAAVADREGDALLR